MKRKSKIIITDIETMASLFVVVNKNKQDDSYSIFEISDTNNQLEEMKAYYGSLNKNDYMVTYNGLDFDWPILDWILKQKKVKASHIYKYTQKLIESDEKWKFKPNHNKISQIDLFKLNHYDRLGVSLKYLQFTTRWKTMQDIPYHHSQHLTRFQELEVIDYCINDVDSTDHFLNECKDKIKLRFELSKKFNKNMLNDSDTNIGKFIALSGYCETANKNQQVVKALRTYRSEIKIKDIIFDYVKFKTPEFNDVLNQFKSTIVNKSTADFKIQKEFKGVTYDFALGGIHSAQVGVFEDNDDYIIRDWDVTSYYPQLAIQNKLYPKHLGPEFCTAYANLFKERTKYNKKTHFAENYAIKIALNSVYGLSQSEHSFVYDPLLTFSITVNGQLSLLMLIERILLLDSAIECISSNTDGATFRFPKKYEKKIEWICKKWEQHTKLNLEDVLYSKVFSRDVNNYIAIYTNGTVKFKGCYEIDPTFNKNSSQRIVRIAVANYIINSIPLKNTIVNHIKGEDYKIGNTVIKNYGIFDFCIGKKATVSNYTLLEEGCEPKLIQDKVLRFYVANSRKKLVKKYTSGEKKGGIQAVVKGWFIEMFMNYEKKEDYNIQYLYYIEEANKLIREVEKPSNNVIHAKQTKLW